MGPMPVRSDSAAVLGGDESLLAAGRLDNHSRAGRPSMRSSHPAATATPSVIALFDHEEVGSESTTGAAEAILEPSSAALAGQRRPVPTFGLQPSTCVSADNARSTPQLSRASRSGPSAHRQQGPGHQLNSNQRCAASARSRQCCGGCSTKPAFRRGCSSAATTCPVARRSDPSRRRLGIETVDVGVHSFRCTQHGSCAAWRIDLTGDRAGLLRPLTSASAGSVRQMTQA